MPPLAKPRFPGPAAKIKGSEGPFGLSTPIPVWAPDGRALSGGSGSCFRNPRAALDRPSSTPAAARPRKNPRRSPAGRARRRVAHWAEWCTTIDTFPPNETSPTPRLPPKTGAVAWWRLRRCDGRPWSRASSPSPEPRAGPPTAIDRRGSSARWPFGPGGFLLLLSEQAERRMADHSSASGSGSTCVSVPEQPG